MKHHERMWGIYKKNKGGLVTMEDMKRAPGGGMGKDDKVMKDGKTEK